MIISDYNRKKIYEARSLSFGTEVKLKLFEGDSHVYHITFIDGEVDRVMFTGPVGELKRGMVVEVNTKHMKNAIAIVVGFNLFNHKEILISRGGGSAELNMYVGVNEITLFKSDVESASQKIAKIVLEDPNNVEYK